MRPLHRALSCSALEVPNSVALADSGIYLRGCPQVQIWDSTETEKFPIGADKGSGGLWNNSPGTLGKDPLVKADKPFGQWNKLRIIMAGSRVWVWLNDQQTVNGAYFKNYHYRNLPVPTSGPLQLQTHGGEIRWRNLLIRDIASEESITILRANETSGLESIFNGKDLAGWTGRTDCCRRIRISKPHRRVELPSRLRDQLKYRSETKRNTNPQKRP
jgi:hypothetical protein